MKNLSRAATGLQACRIRSTAPRAFTLVELLVVIGIIALLAAIITPVVMQSLAKARNAAIKAEIDMLHMAIMNYKNEYGSFPPCYDDMLTATSPAGKHLVRIFPRCSGTAVPTQFANLLASKSPAFIVPSNAISFWLSGFTSNPTAPLSPGDRQALFDFDRSRVDSNSGVFHPSQKPGSPYVYISRNEYSNSWPPSAFSYSVSGKVYSIPADTFFAHRIPPPGTSNFAVVTQEPFNSDSFQILCAGRDEEFGNDDDLSNFWPGTRREYLDSLKD